jgi:hypothetical protein
MAVTKEDVDRREEKVDRILATMDENKAMVETLKGKIKDTPFLRNIFGGML